MRTGAAVGMSYLDRINPSTSQSSPTSKRMTRRWSIQRTEYKALGAGMAWSYDMPVLVFYLWDREVVLGKHFTRWDKAFLSSTALLIWVF